MERKRRGIGALGSAQARFFHPIAKIREKWPNDHKRLSVEIVVVTGKELFRISRRDQLAYKCRIAKIDNGIEFHICPNNFRVDQDPVQPFEDESMATACDHPAAEPDNINMARVSNENASNNIGQGANQEDIAELRRQGVEASSLRMRTASLKTFPLAKTKIRYRGCTGNGLPQLLVQGGGFRTSVMQRGDGKTTVGVR